MTKRYFHYCNLLITLLVLGVGAAQAQTAGSQATSAASRLSLTSQVQLTDFLAQTGRGHRLGFSLMPPSSVKATTSGLARMAASTSANLQVQGSGTTGRITKWIGSTSSNSTIGDTTIFEDKFGNVGIGTDAPTSRLVVAGKIETTSGGIKFPDGTVQVTAGISANQTLGVHDLDNPVRQPVQETVSCFFAASSCQADMYTVPAGKRFVIEYASVTAILAAGQVALCDITTELGGNTVSHKMSMSPPAVATVGGNGVISIGQQVRLYADPGSVVKMNGSRNATSGGVGTTFFFTISGYLVDIP